MGEEQQSTKRHYQENVWYGSQMVDLFDLPFDPFTVVQIVIQIVLQLGRVLVQLVDD